MRRLFCLYITIAGSLAVSTVLLAQEYNPGEVAWSRSVGTATIAGSASGTKGNQRYSCAGFSVMLIPKSSFADHRMLYFFGNTEAGTFSYRSKKLKISKLDAAAYTRDSRQQNCTDEGKFLFQSVPAGKYYLMTSFFQYTVNRVMGVGDFKATSGGFSVMRSITVGENETVHADLTLG